MNRIGVNEPSQGICPTIEEVLQFPTLTNEKARISEKGATDSGLGLSNRMPYYDVSIIY